MRALAIAATGMSAQEQNLEVIANNIANINTTGFKRSRAEFTDLIYQTERLMGVSNRGRDATIPEGAQIGLGVRTAAIRSVNIQGALTNTGNTLDLAINGRGWFQVTTPTATPSIRATARSTPTPNGQLVTMDGYTVTPPILVPATRQRHHQPDRSRLGDHSWPDDAAAARPIDDRELHQRCRPAGARRQLLPADRRIRPADRRRSRRHRLRHHSARLLEASNVDPVTEITNLIAAQRAYEMNSKVIQAADQMSGTISNLRARLKPEKYANARRREARFRPQRRDRR